MAFGQKIANRIVLAYLVPVAFMLALSILVVHLHGDEIGLPDYIVGMVLVLIPALIIGRLLTYSITLHLEQLRRSAEQIERGDYTARAVPSAKDEFADLARAFNHMADVLASRESALREQNQTLASVNHRFEAVLNAANDGIAMLDSGGCFVLANRRFGELLGTRSQLLLHRTLEEARPLLVDRLSHRLAALAPTETRAVAEEIIALDAPDRRFLQFYTAPVAGEDGQEAIGRIIALRDITRERELDKMKTDFISVVSHELRTPLTSLKGYTDLLLSGAAGETTELQAEFLGIIQLSTTRLSHLINDILDISRIESGTLEIKHEPIDYREIVADTLRLMKPAADAKRIRLEAALPQSIPPVRGDADKVTQVLTNLVSNAIKYTPQEGHVKVTLELSADASVTTCVADSGIGVAPEDQAKLFQKFFRADNTSTREAGGTGLGLVIAKTLIELMGGTIWLESEAGQNEPKRGSRFYFTLPLFLEEHNLPAPAPVALPERGIGLVLVIDDDPYVRSLIRQALHRRGYGTLEAANCAEAQQKARLHKPDAIVLDVMLPERDGLRTLHALKKDRATASIPLVALSVLGDPARGDLTVGAFSFLQKPLILANLPVLIASAFGARLEETLALIVCGSETEVRRDFDAAAPTLREEHGITLRFVEFAPEAVAEVITERPGLLVIDTAMPDTELFDLLTALKAEEEAARTPVVLLTDDIPQSGLHFHMGADMDGCGELLDYLCELLSRAIPGWEKPAK